jgi:Helix-turn-helix domain
MKPALAFQPAPVQEAYIDPEEAALFLRLSAKTLTRLARKGEVPAHARSVTAGAGVGAS